MHFQFYECRLNSQINLTKTNFIYDAISTTHKM